MFYDILDQKRLDILPSFSDLKNDFYLAGGTALALQIGHRDSVDFDFFCKTDINTGILFERLREIFKQHALTKIQEEPNTLTILINESIKVSFFTYKYKLCKDLIMEADLALASIEDIGCMKLSTITSRATNKDYIDLYFILQRLNLSELLKLCDIKYPEIDQNVLLKSLVYFEDITQEPILFKNNNHVAFEVVEDSLKRAVKNTKRLA